MADVHDLDRYCRVCGGRVQKAKRRQPVYQCAQYKVALHCTFNIDVATDDVEIHPTSFCNSYYAAVRRQTTASSKGLPYQHSIEVFPWEKHREEECTVRSEMPWVCMYVFR